RRGTRYYRGTLAGVLRRNPTRSAAHSRLDLRCSESIRRPDSGATRTAAPPRRRKPAQNRHTARSALGNGCIQRSFVVSFRRPTNRFLNEPVRSCRSRGAGSTYHTNGTRRCRTRFWYSLYPARFLARKRSSSKSRQIRNGIMAAIETNPQYEPSANGVPATYSNPPAYIGGRTTAYGPVGITF